MRCSCGTKLTSRWRSWLGVNDPKHGKLDRYGRAEWVYCLDCDRAKPEQEVKANA